MADLTLRYLLFGEDRTASKAVKGVGDAAESTASRVSGAVGRMGSAIGGDMGAILGRVSDGLEVAGGKADTNAKRLGAVGGVALATGVALQQMASGDVEAQNKLENAIANTGKSFDDYADHVAAAVESSVRFGVTDGEVKDALTRLTDATKDPAKALDDLAMAQDLAAAKGISLSDAATMIGKAHNGSAKIFKEFGVEVGTLADGTADYESALGQLADTLKGRAEANADSFGGKMRELRAWTDNAASSFAEQYGPAITAAGAALTGLAAVTEIASAANVKNAASTVAAKAAQIGSAVATGVATAAQWAWNVALNANPIGLIIIAIAAFVGAILWLWNNVDWFRNGVTAAWEAIKTGWEWLWNNAIEPGIEAFGAAFRWLWNSVLAPVTRFILNGFATLTDGIGSFLDALSTIPGFGWAKDAADKMHGAAGAARDLAGRINDIPNNVPVTVTMSIVGVQAVKNAINGIGGSMSARLNARLDGFPGNARGTDFWRGGLTWVGEEGPELVNLPRGSQVIPADTSRAIAASGVAPSGAGAGAATPSPTASEPTMTATTANKAIPYYTPSNGFATLTDGIGSFLDALSTIPGFGWAKDAADKMHGAAGAARDLAGRINDIPNNVPVTVTMSIVGVQAVKNAINGIGGSMSARLNARLDGFPGNARGTDFWRGGLTWVGEEGPELVNLPRGSQVIPADTSRAIAASGVAPSGAGAGAATPIVLQLDSRAIWRGLLRVKADGGVELGLA